MFPLANLSALALAMFISISAGSPLKPRTLNPGWTLLGYRTVTKFEADSINKVGALFYSDHFDNGQQLGKGKSLSGAAGQWDVSTDSWYCYIIMPDETLHSLHKIWIPSSRYFSDESQIAAFVTGQGLPVSETLRFGQVQGRTFDELFIPSELLKADKHDMFAQCYPSINELENGMKKENYATPGATVDYTTVTFAGPKPAS